MATLVTKYSIGDRVWHASTGTERRQHPCPDCLGSRQWKATSPAGHEYTFACPRCAGNFFGRDEASITYTAHKPWVRALTIGSVRVDTASESRVNEYMCRETGVGSGNVYSEADLYITEAEALIAATALAALRDTTVPYVAAQYTKTLEIRDYELDSAVLKRAQDERSKARMLVYGIEDMMAAVNEASDLDAAREAVSDYREFGFARDREKVARDEKAVAEEVL